jgi:uncharacterized protein
MQGKIGWLELYSEDSEASATFYEKTFGWKIQRDPNMGDYIMFMDATDDLGGGFTKDASPQGGGLYILVDSIDASLKQIEAAGGQRKMERTLISDEIGWWANFTDPSGNVMGLFEQPARG